MPPELPPELLYQPLIDLQTGAVLSLQLRVRDAAGLGSLLRRAGADLQPWPLLRLALEVDAVPCAALAAALADCALAPARLTLEVGQAALADPGCSALLEDLKQRGMGLTLSRFGAGPAALAHLKSAPFDAVKLAPECLRDVAGNGGEAAWTRGLIALAHHLGLRALADGVDTEAQCDFLRRNMCDGIQGALSGLPMTAAALQRSLATAPALPPHLLRLHKPPRRLLLVDDEPNILAALKRLLRPDQYQIQTAHDGPQGLALLAAGPVDVIVSDQRMPGMLGADFLRKARELAPDSIRIMLSGYTELQSVTDAVNEGAIYKFLTKPWDDEQLRGHIAEAFRVKEIADDNLHLHLQVRSANAELAAANRRMEQLLLVKQRQISRDEISLGVAREILQHLPLPVIGLDNAGMVAFVNAAAGAVFGHHGALLGEAAVQALPELFAAGAVRQEARIGAHGYAVRSQPMGAWSTSRGSLITLSPLERADA
jgi:CheY-like chemotaxis protein